MNTRRVIKPLICALAAVAICGAHGHANAEERCCLNNFRFAGGCMVIVRGDETCQDVLAYLNNFNSVGKYYCDNTTIRGGWSLVDCGDPARPGQQYHSPRFAEPAEPVQQRQQGAGTVEPETAPAAQNASLLQVSAPLAVRFSSGVDSHGQNAGQLVTGTLEKDLVSGDTVIAPAGSEVQFRIVPTSFWTDGAGDAFEIQAVAVKVGNELVPIEATAVSATGEIDTSGAEIAVPEGSLVSFEARASDQHSADTSALQAGAAAWMEAFEARDLGAINALYAEDAVLLPPDAPAIFGRDAIGATMREMFAAGLAIELEDLEIEVAGDLGYKAGRYRTLGEDGTLVDRGKYIEIWSKTDDGWVIHRDIWNSSVQPQIDHGHDE